MSTKLWKLVPGAGGTYLQFLANHSCGHQQVRKHWLRQGTAEEETYKRGMQVKAKEICSTCEYKEKAAKARAETQAVEEEARQAEEYRVQEIQEFLAS